MRDWIGAFNTALIASLANPDLAVTSVEGLMQTPEFASLLIAARHLAESQGLTAEDACEKLVSCFRNLEQILNRALLKKGIESLLS